MKRIQLDAVSPPRDPQSAVTAHTLHTVFLGNRHKLYFSSSRHAEQFNASATDFLNGSLFRASVLLADAYPLWRMAWWYLDKAPACDREAEQAIKAADELLNRALRKRGGTDYITYAWKDVRMCVAHVRDLCIALREFYRNKGHGVDRARLDVLIETANELHDRLATFGSVQSDAPNAVIVQPHVGY